MQHHAIRREPTGQAHVAHVNEIGILEGTHGDYFRV